MQKIARILPKCQTSLVGGWLQAASQTLVAAAQSATYSSSTSANARKVHTDHVSASVIPAACSTSPCLHCDASARCPLHVTPDFPLAYNLQLYLACSFIATANCVTAVQPMSDLLGVLCLKLDAQTVVSAADWLHRAWQHGVPHGNKPVE